MLQLDTDYRQTDNTEYDSTDKKIDIYDDKYRDKLTDNTTQTLPDGHINIEIYNHLSAHKGISQQHKMFSHNAPEQVISRNLPTQDKQP